MRKKTQKSIEDVIKTNTSLLEGTKVFQNREKFFELIADNTPAFIAYVDSREHYRFTNKVFQEWLGYSKEETYYKTVREIRGEADYKTIKPNLRKALSGQLVTYDHRFKKKDGNTIFVNAKYVPHFDESGTVEGAYILLVDITDRKLIEERMQESEERLHRLIAGNIIGVVISGLGGAIYEANDIYLKMVGYTREELQAGKVNWLQMTPPEYWEINKKAEKEILRNGASTPYEKEYIRKDGSRLAVLIGDVLLDKPSRKLIAFVLDISKTKELEKRKDEFIALASHELKTPLTSLKMYGQLVQRDIQTGKYKDSEKLLNKMDRQIDNLTELVNGLLDVSRIQSGKLQYKKETFALDKLIKDCVEELQRMSINHRLIIKGSMKLKIKADRERIKQVINNLITNAVKYSPKADKVIIELRLKKESAQVCIQDFGIGIPENQKKSIFDRFFQVRRPLSHTYSGLGLGLYLCKEIMDRHNGKIWVKSNRGKGSKFFFSLPVNIKKYYTSKIAITLDKS